MATSYGKVLRKIRIDHDELLKDMAEKLRITSAYLSAIENGKRPIPSSLSSSIKVLYDLANDDYEKLLEAEDKVRTSIDIDLSEANHVQKRMVLALARKFEKLSDDDLEVIRRILEK